MNRARTIRGLFGKATAVATITTGLMAGAASRKVNAAAGGAPLSMRRLATGTELHSHPGNNAPDTPASGTASTARRGSTRANAPSGTNAATAPLMSTPRTRNGNA